MFKCIINNCIEKASYNYKTCYNPAYCYKHKEKDMIKFGSYDRDDFLEIVFVTLERLL